MTSPKPHGEFHQSQLHMQSPGLVIYQPTTEEATSSNGKSDTSCKVVLESQLNLALTQCLPYMSGILSVSGWHR